MSDRIEQIIEYVKKLDPQVLSVSDIHTVSAKEMNRGGYNANYLIIVNEGKKFVFRINLDKYLDVPNQTEYEFRILTYLDEKGITPKVFYRDTSKSFLKHNILIEDFLEGEPLLSINQDNLTNLASLVLRLHSIPRPIQKFLITNKSPLTNQLLFILGKLEFVREGNYNPKFIKFIDPRLVSIKDYVKKFATLFSEGQITINHRDLVVENIMKTPTGLRLVDWQAVMIDDPSYDLAFFANDIVSEWSIKRKLSDEEKNIFLEAYLSKSSDKALAEKTKVRSPMIYLELFVWAAYRAAYLRNKLKNGLVEQDDLAIVEGRINVFESFLKEDYMKNYLHFFPS